MTDVSLIKGTTSLVPPAPSYKETVAPVAGTGLAQVDPVINV